MSASAQRDKRDLAVSAALAAFAFAAFALLPQRVFHGYDTDFYAMPIQAGDLRRVTTHVAYVPLCWLVRTALGVGAVQAMLLASAAGSAIGVFFTHRAALRLCGTQAAVATAAVALTPSCFYFATAPEVPGAFAAAAGAAWWAFARWRDGRRLADAVLLGAVCGAAAPLHAFGHLLPPTFVAVMLVQRAMSLRQLVVPVCTIAAVHALVATAIPWALGHGGIGQGTAAATMVAEWSAAMEPGSVLTTLFEQAVVPYLPWSLLALAGLGFARARPWSLAWLVAVALHAPIMCLLIARGRVDVPERGAYLLPAALPAVLAAMALLRRPWPWLAVALSAGLSLLLVVPRWTPVYRQEFVDAVSRLAGEREVAFIVGPAELEGVRTHLEDVFCVEVVRSMEAYFRLSANGAPRPPLAAWFDAVLVHTGGSRTWIVTREAQQSFLTLPAPEAQQLWREHVPAAYELVPVQRPGLEGAVELRRRP